MALTPSEVETIERLRQQLTSSTMEDELLWRYYTGRQRVEQLGMAVPPEMRRFLVITNWCRTLVDTINERQQVRSLILPGQETADPRLRAILDASNMEAHLSMFNTDRLVYGRAFLSVGANEADAELPLIRVESPREMAAEVDVRREVVTAAARFFGVDPITKQGPTQVTLYLPNETVWVQKDRATNRWAETARDQHMLGAVPVLMHLNRRQSRAWTGESQMTDLIPLVDSAARSLTNLQFAQEAHGVPRMWMAGVKKEHFIGADGKPIPQFEAYFDAIHTITDAAGKVGQLTAADLKNFETAMSVYGKEAANVSGFPARYFGIHSVNPPAEGAIRADEARLIRSVEAQNQQVGMTLGWAAALALRFATGEWVQGNRVRVDWHDPATPTVAQRMDAVTKAVGSGILSREGAWTELGWSEARKDAERKYFEAELLDPIARQLLRDVADADSVA